MISTFLAKFGRLGFGRLGAIITAGISLGVTAIAPNAALGQGQGPAVSNDAVSYDDAMACGALFALLAGSLEGEAEGEQLLDTAVQWLAVAARRAQAVGAVANETDLYLRVGDLMALVEDLEDDAKREKFLLDRIDQCEAKYLLIADEFES
jgi:hypothetical protein